jgi:hypothetical protein
MKNIKSLFITITLLFGFLMVAQGATEILSDGTEITYETMVIGEDGTIQYLDAEGNIVAEVSSVSTDDGSEETIKVRGPNGRYTQRVVELSPTGTVIDIGATNPASAPTPVTPASDGGAVGGSPNTSGPDGGTSIPSVGQTVV